MVRFSRNQTTGALMILAAIIAAAALRYLLR
jgi:hypothetical protein